MPSENVVFASADQEETHARSYPADQSSRYPRRLPVISEGQRRGPAGARKSRSDDSFRRNRRPAWPVRIGQVDAAAHHRRTDRAVLRRCQMSRRDDCGTAEWRLHGVSVLCAVSVADGAAERRIGAGSAGDRQRRAPQAGARRDRPDRSRRLRVRLPQGIVGRHAAARRVCTRAGGASRPVADGRAVFGARRTDRRDAAHRPDRSLDRRPAADQVGADGDAQHRGSGADVRPHSGVLVQSRDGSPPRSRSICRIRAIVSIRRSGSSSTASMRA